MSSVYLQCSKCGRKYPFKMKYFRCDECNEPLEVKYDYEMLREKINRETFVGRINTIWRYMELFPLKHKHSIVSLNEGYTPLIKAEKLGKLIGVNNLYMKDETRNPTMSFKDRGSAVGISVAIENGANLVACASTGNMAASLAAYSSKAGIRSIILVPKGVSREKLAQIAIYEPLILEVDKPYPELYRFSFHIARNYNVALIHSDSPLRVEGQKTIGFEILEQLNWIVPDWVIVPTSSGGNFSAIWKGFKEFYALDLIEELPGMIAVQSEGCAPIVRAFKEKRANVEPWGEPRTIAHSISNPDPSLASGNRVLRILRECNGYAETVSDEEIIRVLQLIASREGIFVEPASATSIAVISKLLNEGIIDRKDLVVSILTGSGLKEVKSIEAIPKNIKKISTLRELERIVIGVR